jgi:hypothetical protein
VTTVREIREVQETLRVLHSMTADEKMTQLGSLGFTDVEIVLILRLLPSWIEKVQHALKKSKTEQNSLDHLLARGWTLRRTAEEVKHIPLEHQQEGSVV